MKHRSIGCLAIVASLVLSSGPVLASEPGPVIAIDGDGPPAGDSPPAADSPPGYDPTEPYQDDQGGRCPAGNTRMGPDGVIELNLPAESNQVPGPVVAIDPAPATPDAPCLSDLRLELVVEAPDGKKPDGADASLDGLAVPRSALEGGFEVTLPAQDRTITLAEPGDNWELKSTVCSCSGWTTLTASGSSTMAVAELASYPQPVVAVEPAPPGGPGGCAGAAPFGISSVSARPSVPVSSAASEITAYPGPVIAVDQLPHLQAPQVDWDTDGTVTIVDPDAVGGTFTCVWTVELVYGQLDIETVTTPSGEENRFRYELVPTGGQPDATALTVRGNASERLRWGPWSAGVVDLPEGWKVESSSCSESDISLVSLADGPSASVGLDPDDKVRCRFELELLGPRPGTWDADNRRGRVVCADDQGRAFLDGLAQTFDVGQLRVEDEGDKLVGVGRGNEFTWRRDRDDPLRYRGTKQFKDRGFTIDFIIRLDLRSETRLVGNLRVELEGRGVECTAQRPLRLTHASVRRN